MFKYCGILHAINNEYAVKTTIVLSSLWQVTLCGIRSKWQLSLRETKHNKEVAEMQAVTQAAIKDVRAVVKAISEMADQA